MTKPTISFEYFPPKTPEAEQVMWENIPVLIALEPKFMTVTYGAGGSTKDKTRQIARKLIGMTDIPIAAHLTFLTTTRDFLDEYIESLWEFGIKHIVALRGDVPRDKTFDDFKGEEYYTTTPEFIRAIKDKHDFEISVGAYPEKHPDAPTLDADIQTLKEKCEAGAARAITQFFFDNEKYYAFLEKCRKAGIETPVYPGLLPIHDFPGMCRFAGNCETHVPDWLHEKFAGLEDKPEEAQKIATELLVQQVTDLAKNGVEHIHFYTLNKAPITKEACEALGYSV